MTPPKNDGFSLASGDFPTLGSVKESSGKNSDFQGSTSLTSTSIGDLFVLFYAVYYFLFGLLSILILSQNCMVF